MHKTIRYVADSNVIVSAFNFGGLPARVVSASLDQGNTLYLSQFILDEVGTTLERKFKWPPERLRRLERSLRQQSTIVMPTDRVTIVRDEKDNRILECALAAQAHYLVSGDDDLLSLKKYGKVKIVTPARFLQVMATTAKISK